jgi:hypothetical protein
MLHYWIFVFLFSPCLFIFVSTLVQIKFFKTSIIFIFLENFNPHLAMILSSLWIWGLVIDFVTLIMISIEVHLKGKSSFPIFPGAILYFIYSILQPQLLFFEKNSNSLEISFLKVLEFLALSIFGISMIFIPQIILLIAKKISDLLDLIGWVSLANLVSSKRLKKRNKNQN